MFDTLTERLTQSLRNVTGSGQLTEDNIKDTLREVRMALLEADVALPVTREFIAKVKEEALGQEVMTQLSPGQAFVKIVYDELTKMMGEANESLDLAAKPPVVVLLAGLQGAGKTTTAAKLARFLQERQKKKVAMVSADVYRPAAIKQLQTVAGDVGAIFLESNANERPIDIANRAIEQAKIQFADVLIVDTAGRLHVDDDMMDEIKALHAAINPTETLFVVDAMTGQDAANTAKAFNDALPLTGVILTKTDGDARVVRRCRCVPLPASQSNSWGWVKNSMPWSHSIRNVWRNVFWAWVMCFLWSKKLNAKSTKKKPKKWRKNCKKAAASTLKTC